MGQSLDIGCEDLARMTVQREPTLEIFRIPAKLLEAECAIVAHEDIDATIASRAIKRRDNNRGHAESGRKFAYLKHVSFGIARIAHIETWAFPLLIKHGSAKCRSD
jgi:hypothetical protein